MRKIQYTGTNFEDVKQFCEEIGISGDMSFTVFNDGSKSINISFWGDNHYTLDDYRENYYISKGDYITNIMSYRGVVILTEQEYLRVFGDAKSN